jgi:hypothetical protein
MSNIQTFDDENLTLTPNKTANLESTESQNTLAPSDQEPDVKPEDAKNPEVTQEGEGKDQPKPEPTEEELKQQELETQKLKEENDRKAEQGKIAALERERNVQSEAFDIVAKLQSEDYGTLVELASNKAKYEKVKPYISKIYPAYNTLSFEDFSSTIQSHFKEQAQTDPDQIETLNKINRSQIVSEVESQYQVQQAKLEIKYDLASRVPEFGNLLKANPTKANSIVEKALTVALTMYDENTTAEQAEEITKKALFFVAPELGQISPSTLQNSKTAVENNLKNTLKGASTSQTTNSQTPSEIKNLPSYAQKVYKDEYDRLIKKGSTPDQAHKESLELVL